MTVLAAVFESPTSYALASDSEGEVNWLRIPSPKTRRCGAVLVGYTGNAREGRIGLDWFEAAYAFYNAPLPDVLALRAVADHVRAQTDRKRNEDADACWLVVCPSGVFAVGSDGNVTQAPERWAMGCGEEVALGAMFDRDYDPATVARLAVKAAIRYRQGCSGVPVVLVPE
jgi:ATP-dependent protease HslVU (ClpYQ) peptidase subunit